MGLSQEENLAERGPLVTVGGPLAKTRKKTWKMMVNPDVDGYTKTLKSLESTPKNVKNQESTENKNDI